MKHNRNKINNKIEALIEKVENTCLFSLNIKDNLYKLGTSMIGSRVRFQFIKSPIFVKSQLAKSGFYLVND